MSRKLGFSSPKRLTTAVFVIFSLLTAAVIASEARSDSPVLQPAEITSTTGVIQDSLLVSRVGNLVRMIGRRLASP